MRPYVILNAAMTLDGKIATRTGSSNISGKEDLERVHQIRKDCDGIMVGIGTVIADDPRLTVHKIDARPEDNPVRIVVDSRCRTPVDSRITNSDAKTIIAGANEYKEEYMKTDAYETLKKRGVKFFFSGAERVLEGGATLNFPMIKSGLIDEISICVAAVVAGGANATTFFDGDGFDEMDDAVKLELIDYYPLGKDFILNYRVLND